MKGGKRINCEVPQFFFLEIWCRGTGNLNCLNYVFFKFLLYDLQYLDIKYSLHIKKRNL